MDLKSRDTKPLVMLTVIIVRSSLNKPSTLKVLEPELEHRILLHRTTDNRGFFFPILYLFRLIR